MRRAIVLVIVAACGGEEDAVLGDAVSIDAVAVDAETDAGARAFVEDFGTGDAAAWPGGWTPLGGVASATIEDGRARLIPVLSGYSLGRMGHPIFVDNADVEASFTLEMHDVARQGVGFYVRQNGGYLTQTSPTGAGYAVFVEGFNGHYLSLWRERNGVEEVLTRSAIPPLENGVRYSVRFVVTQQGDTTQLSAAMWRVSDPSTQWMAVITDATPTLQHLEGAIAVDAWNTVQTGGSPPPAPIYVDDIVIVPAD